MGNLETGKLISEIRKQKNMTQRDLADLLNVSDKAVSKWERGESYPEITILLQLSDILEITVDELLSGYKKTDTLKNETGGNESNLAHLWLLEDVQNKYYQNSIIAYLIICAGILVCSSLTLNYNIGQIIGSMLGVFGIVYYKFSLNKHRTSLTRLGCRHNITRDDANFRQIKKYTDLFILVASFPLFIIIISGTLRDKIINGYWLLFLKYNVNLIIPIILAVTAVNLIIYCVIYKKLSSIAAKNYTKLFWFSGIGTCLSSVSSFILFEFKLFLITSSSHYNKASFESMAIGLGIFNLSINIILLFVFVKKKYPIPLIILISNIIQYIIFALGIDKNIVYLKNLPSNMLADVFIQRIIITFMLVLSIYHLTNLFILKCKTANSRQEA